MINLAKRLFGGDSEVRDVILVLAALLLLWEIGVRIFHPSPLILPAPSVIVAAFFETPGLFLRHLAGPSAVWRYLCDSSYFLYIAHMPVIMALQLVVEPLALPPVAKVPIVLAATTLVLLVSYRYAVRPTFIGAVLNGRRYPAAAPAPLTASA